MPWAPSSEESCPPAQARAATAPTLLQWFGDVLLRFFYRSVGGRTAGEVKEYEFCRTEKDGHLLIVTMTRANQLNALHPPAHLEYQVSAPGQRTDATTT